MCSFSMLSFLVTRFMINGVLIQTFGINEVEASFFTLGLITNFLVLLPIFDSGFVLKETTYVFSHLLGLHLLRYLQFNLL